jgi:hypothetical protein
MATVLGRDEGTARSFYGEKPENPTACGGGEWQSRGFGGGRPLRKHSLRASEARTGFFP